MKKESATPLAITGWAMEQHLVRRIELIEELLRPIADPEKLKRLSDFLDRIKELGG